MFRRVMAAIGIGLLFLIVAIPVLYLLVTVYFVGVAPGGFNG